MNGGAAWALALLISMFALKWYGVDGIPGRSRTVVSAVNAWQGLTVLSWLMLAVIALAFVSVPLHLSQRLHGARTDTSPLVAISATVMAALVAYRVLVDLPRPDAIVDQKLGAIIGLACALALSGCAWGWVRDVRRPGRRPPARVRRRTARAAASA